MASASASNNIAVVAATNRWYDALASAMSQVQDIQKEFAFCEASEELASEIRMRVFRRIHGPAFLDELEVCRSKFGSPETPLIVAVDSPLDGKRLTNLFATERSRSGLAVVTTSQVADAIVPGDRMEAYFVYYLARYALSFRCPEIKTHREMRSCVFDRKESKRDLLESMKTRALCDPCRRQLLEADPGVTGRQLEALDRLFQLAGNLVEQLAEE